MITSAYSYVLREAGTDRVLGAVTVNTITLAGGALIARAVMADRYGLPIDQVEVMDRVVEVAGLVSNPGEDFRERARLDKLARRFARRFKRLSEDERSMVMPAVLKAVCPGLPLVIWRDPADFEEHITGLLNPDDPNMGSYRFRKTLNGELVSRGAATSSKGAVKRAQNIPDFIPQPIARNGDVR